MEVMRDTIFASAYSGMALMRFHSGSLPLRFLEAKLTTGIRLLKEPANKEVLTNERLFINEF